VSVGDPSGLVVVASFHHLWEADVAKALLGSFDIEAIILDEVQMQQRWPVMGRLAQVRLAVAPERAYRARQILEDDHSAALEEIAEVGGPAEPEEG